MDDTRLIVEVEKHKILYDPQNMLYKDLNAKEKAWEAISSAIDVDGKFQNVCFKGRLHRSIFCLTINLYKPNEYKN